MAVQSVLRTVYLFLVAPVEISLSTLRQLLFSILPAGRQSRKWTLRASLLVQFTRSLLRALSIGRVPTRLSLDEGSEGDRFTIVLPAAAEYYVGPLEDPEVYPRATGGTWTPKCPIRVGKPTATDPKKDLLVALHFHGGAFVIGSGRDHDTGFVPDLLLNNAGCTHVFTPQYRLATSPKERFPAALQDAVSAYMYLIEKLGIPTNRIVLSGDSAGGSLALGLLRYIHDHGAELGMPRPAVALLWSPWTDITAGEDAARVQSLPNYSADYLDKSFIVWGTTAITGGGRIPACHPYLSPGRGQSFVSETPMWVHSGGIELLYHENMRFVEEFRDAGNEVEWVVDEHCPHDMPLMGKPLGFVEESRAAATKAGDFIRRHLS